MIPTYQQPQGYSSTYYHDLQRFASENQPESAAQLPLNPAEKPVTLSPVLTEKARVGGPKDDLPKPIEFADQLRELEHDAPPAATKKGSWWSWIQRSSANKPEQGEGDDELIADEIPLDAQEFDDPSALSESEIPPDESPRRASWWSWVRRPLNFRFFRSGRDEADDLELDRDDQLEALPPE